MLFYRLWNYIIGYVVIRVEGLSLEKFINITVARGIRLWGINRENYTTLTACISIKGFKQLHSISHKVRCRISIIEKRGLPFKTYKYRNRKMLIIGMLFFLLMLFGFASFIWEIEVEGTEKVDPNLIIKELEKLDIKPGILRTSIDTLKVENRLLINMPELSWISLEIRGSKLIIRVAESVEPPQMIDNVTPSNIVAAKDAIIEKMIVLGGQPVVEEGATVKKGQLLVNGIIDHPQTTGVRYVHSMGQIMARVWYKGNEGLDLGEPLRERTGEKIEMRYLGWEKFKVPYQKEEIWFNNYELEVEIDGFLIIETYYEINEIDLRENINVAKKKLEKEIMDKLKLGMPEGAKIIDKKLKYDMIEGEKLVCTIQVEVLEDIGEQQAIELQ